MSKIVAMNLKRFATSIRISVAIMSCTALPLFAASNPWNATWQLNAAQSAVPGPTFVLSQNADGEYQMEMANQKFTFRCDSKDYAINTKSQINCKQPKPTEMDVFLKEDGIITSTEHHVLSKDGKTQTVDKISHADKMQRDLKTQTYQRISDSTGFAGAWKETTKGADSPVILQTTLTKSTFEMNYPDKKMDTVFKLDGTDTTVHGMPSGGTLAIKQASPLQMESTTKMKGEVTLEGTYTISEDGKTLTEEWWRPDHPIQKGRKVYDKQ
jgi:hypothetical protein